MAKPLDFSRGSGKKVPKKFTGYFSLNSSIFAPDVV